MRMWPEKLHADEDLPIFFSFVMENALATYPNVTRQASAQARAMAPREP